MGFWLHGVTGAYSATITVPVTVSSPKFSWCAYVSNYPPNATPNNNGSYDLHGTKPFVIDDVSNGTAATFTGCIHSLTDATGCPGLVPQLLHIDEIPTQFIVAGESSTLYVTATHAVAYSFDNGVTWSTNGYFVVSPTVDAAYLIRVKSRGGCEGSVVAVVVVD
jgi:hypothetical protein